MKIEKCEKHGRIKHFIDSKLECWDCYIEKSQTLNKEGKNEV